MVLQHDCLSQSCTHTKESILTPPAIASIPTNQIIDFQFACKIPLHLEHHANDLTAYLLDIVDAYIKHAGQAPASQQNPLPTNPTLTKIYHCTFPCDGTFESISSWKRHERDYHEPQRQWICPEADCSMTYWQKRQFERHHEKVHAGACGTKCTHGATAVADVLPTKTAWGCGFCVSVFDSWKARCAHVGKHFEAEPRAEKTDWDQRMVIEGLLLQPRLLEVRSSLLDEEKEMMRIDSGGEGPATPRVAEEILQHLQYLDEHHDHRSLVRDALVYLGLLSGHATLGFSPPSTSFFDSAEGGYGYTTRSSSPPPPSTTYFESTDSGFEYSLSTPDDFLDFSEFLNSDEKALDIGRLCQEKLFDDPNVDHGLGQYGYYTSIDDTPI